MAGVPREYPAYRRQSTRKGGTAHSSTTASSSSTVIFRWQPTITHLPLAVGICFVRKVIAICNSCMFRRSTFATFKIYVSKSLSTKQSLMLSLFLLFVLIHSTLLVLDARQSRQKRFTRIYYLVFSTRTSKYLRLYTYPLG